MFCTRVRAPFYILAHRSFLQTSLVSRRLSMPTMWSNEMEFSFLEMYQTEPVLWEPSHPYHKDKKYVQEGWVRLSEQLNIPVAELKKKKDSLMATFRGHKRKIKAAQLSVTGSEDIYKPIWFAFDLMDSFLGHVFDGKNTINMESRGNCGIPLPTQPVTSSLPTHGTSRLSPKNVEEKHFMTNLRDLDSNPRPPPDSLASTLTTRPTHRVKVDEVWHGLPNGLQRMMPDGVARSFGGIKRKETNEDFSFVKVEQCTVNADARRRKEAMNSLNRVLHKKQLPEDDCDRYAKILANKLRKLSENERLQFMYEIDGMFIQRISPCPNSNASPPVPSGKQCVSFPTPSPTYYQRQSSSPYSTYSEPSLLEEEDIKMSPPSSCHSESSAISDH